MYRRIAFAAADLSLAVAGVLLVWGFVRPHEDVQRLYAVLLGFATLLVGSVQLAGAMNLPAAAGQTAWRRLRPRWPVIMGVVVIALVTAGIGMAVAAIASPDPHSGSGPVREADRQPVPETVPRSTAPATAPRRPP
jgi:drug/metabolite transporter (DMT)-like permease